MIRVVVAMSGGVDSSVAAALLREQGYEVIGMMLRLWSENGAEQANRCCTPESMEVARRVAAKLNIPFYAIDARQPFREIVVQSFLDGYQSGVTPNPCLVCNQRIRWGFLLEQARLFGANALATGHYARLQRLETSSGVRFSLLRAVDRAKDQSYVLHRLNQQQLRQTMFPIGDYTKDQVRQLAADFNLKISNRPESQDLCFLAGGDYRDFLARYLPEVLRPGAILNPEGVQIGEHRGLAFYTVGQRKGLGIASPEPLYVLRKDIENNALIVGRADEPGREVFFVHQVNWIDGAPPATEARAQVRLRYRGQETGATILPLEGQRALVRLDYPRRDITPGQAAVFYDQELCLGGGLIEPQ